MNELTFIQNNIEKWEHVEIMTKDLSQETPDDIADAYSDVTADLAFAYTHYPSSRIAMYLNNLAAVLHNAIYRNKRERRSRLITFWTREVPATMYAERRHLLASFVVFCISVLIGVASQLAEPDFCLMSTMLTMIGTATVMWSRRCRTYPTAHRWLCTTVERRAQCSSA